MPTLVLNDVPVPLFDQIHRLAQARQRTPADTVLQVLETAFRTVTPALSEPPPPSDTIHASMNMTFPTNAHLRSIVNLIEEGYSVP